jgi:hypothetical protein
VRYVVAGIRVSPEVVEYPDTKQITRRHERGRRMGSASGSCTNSAMLDTAATVSGGMKLFLG